MTKAEKPKPPPLLPFEAYVQSLEGIRMCGRMFEGRADSRTTEAWKEMRACFERLSEGAEREAAKDLNWLADPAEYDARMKILEASGQPFADLPKKYWWDVPQFPRAHYEVDVEWNYLESQIKFWEEDGLNLEPDYQREHVWTMAQRIAYVEYIVQGGEVGSTLVFNHTSWEGRETKKGDLTILDGKQRLETARMFMRDEIPVFGRTLSQWSGRLRMIQGRFKWRIMSLKTKAEVLRAYLSFNAGGTPHTEAELDKVRAMLAIEEAKERGE
jgi:hypothetical protein